jgi:catechol 2,3-dioxygenase-like lactoylglutathione lyase family enzyme
VDGWIHHIDITVSDVARATEFYDRVLPLMGFARAADCDDGPIWAGSQMELGLQRARPASLRAHDRYSPGLHHLAFGAPDRGAVDRAYEELLALGVEVLDAPATYEGYAPGYYAVFFLGPDGVKLEYVHTPRWPTLSEAGRSPT